MMTFTVKTMTGDLIPVEYEPEELTVPGIYHCVILRLRQEQPLYHDAKAWNIQLLPLVEEGEEEDEEKQEDALLEIVRQSGTMLLLVHVGPRLETSLHWMPFLYRHEGKHFVRCVFDAEYQRDGRSQVWSIEAYLHLDDEKTWQMYHARDVTFEGASIVIRSMEHPCTGELPLQALMFRSYEHQPGIWSGTPFHLLPAIYQEWWDQLDHHTESLSSFLRCWHS